MQKLGRMQPPMRRVLAVDAGSRSIKLVLAQSDFGKLRLLKQELIDLQSEGLVSAEETQTHLRALLDQWGRPPLALVLPQHLSTSQVIDLPITPEAEVRKVIHEETVKLSGVSDSRIVYDFVGIESQVKTRQRFWVTLCQENEIRERLTRLGLEDQDLCEITTTANALIAAYRSLLPQAERAILVHQGAQSTVVVILLDGQGAFATSFQMGGDFFTRALARLRNITEQETEVLKRQKNFFSGPDACPEFLAAIEGWVAELKRQLNDWFAQTPGMVEQAPSFELVASGEGFDQAGLLQYLENEAGLQLNHWPMAKAPGKPAPAAGFEVAFGTALQALGYSPQPVSLLPDDYRVAWKKRLARQRLEAASVVLLLFCVLFLALGTWHRLRLIERKQALYDKAKSGLETFDANDSLYSELSTEYDLLRPAFAAQQNTLDTLTTYALLQVARTNQSFWFVLLADQQSYFSQPPASLTATNRPAKTNLVSTGGSERPGSATVVTNLAPPKPGYIAELCIPEDSEAARAVLSRVVNELKQQVVFSKVDLLSDDLRRSMAEPKVVLPDRDYVLALDFAATDFQQPLRAKKAPGKDRGTRRSGRPAMARPSAEEPPSR
jgi:Tfp pilus assembly PilM family ATPase